MILKRWSVEVVGLFSGQRYELPFLRCWRRKAAQAWVERMNAKAQPGGSTEYRLVDRKTAP